MMMKKDDCCGDDKTIANFLMMRLIQFQQLQLITTPSLVSIIIKPKQVDDLDQIWFNSALRLEG